ncbi:MAG: hypothetical protein DSZ06_01230 [Sulfurospirillum sp.]|nr:MAG: hypothetical protein DSZ06_01230 [Sulfurospirillum sp.]
MNNKKGFTLVELIVSIMLLSIIAIFLYSTVSNLQKQNKMFSKLQHRVQKKEKIIDLLYDDIFESDELNITNKEFSLINIKTKSTIFNISHPYVTWLVSRDKNTLLRFESILPFDRLNSQNSYYYHISKVGENCEKFQIYQSSKKNKILIYIKFKEKKPMIYEFAKPLDYKQKDKNSSSVHKKGVHKFRVKTKSNR